MPSYYELDITAPAEVISGIELEFGPSHREFEGSWSYIIEASDPDFINSRTVIMEMIQSLHAKQIIQRNHHVLFWYMYEYVQQCNMDFSPEFLKNLGSLNVGLCISCWEK